MMLPLALGVLFGLTHYFNEFILPKFATVRASLISFTSGVAISYIFLELFPLMIKTTGTFHNSLFLMVLVGFASYHVLEKYVYQHASREKLDMELKEVHSTAYFFYYFVVGILLVDFASAGSSMVLLFFVPLYLNTLLGSFSFETIDEGIRGHYLMRFVLSMPVILGVLFNIYFGVSETISRDLLALVVGILLYIQIRDYLPPEREGRLSMFVLGVVLYSAIIFGLGYLGYIVI